MRTSMRLKLKQWSWIVLAWTCMGIVFSVYDHLLLKTENAAGVAADYSFEVLLVKNMAAGLIASLLGGTLMVFYVNNKLQDRAYAYTLLVVAFSFVLIVAIISALMGLVLVPMQTGVAITSDEGQDAFISFMKDPSHVKAGIAWFFVVSVTQLFLQISHKFGPENFWNILRGKYNLPKEEKKIFMFLDINSSTSIAEQLGDKAYHSLLKDFFADLTVPILNNKGSIYQYVGDEVIISWKYDEGIENDHCVKCFFDMKSRLEENKEKYMHKYGLVPSFKAGIHCGEVIGGEVGIIKRDITYSGNVLNTTSRILAKCGEFREEILASSELLAALKFPGTYISRSLGSIQLRGKNQQVILNSLVPANNPN